MTLRSATDDIGKRHLVRVLNKRVADSDKFSFVSSINGLESLSQTDFIEGILFLVAPRLDRRVLAERLFKAFGSYANVIAAPVEKLKAIEGVEIDVLTAIKLVQSAAVCLLREEIRSEPIIANYESLTRYLRGLLGRERTECIHILFLDSRNHLLADEVLFQGSATSTPFDLRRVVERIVFYHASAIIIVHNHPNGDPQPSRLDIEMTATIKNVLIALNISVHDHIVVSKNECFSFRRNEIL
jgi:DNA repair protein RadC